MKHARLIFAVSYWALCAGALLLDRRLAAESPPTIKVPQFDASKLTTPLPVTISSIWTTTAPTIAAASTLTFTGGESSGWLVIYPGANALEADRYKPANMRITATKEPVVVKKGNTWEITFKP